MVANSIMIAFSGTVTYSDNSISTFEAYYDDMAGNVIVDGVCASGYTPDAVEGIDTSQQVASDDTIASLPWYNAVMDTFTAGLSPLITNIAFNPGAPSSQKTVTDMILHFRGNVTDVDGTITPVSFTYENGNFNSTDSDSNASFAAKTLTAYGATSSPAVDLDAFPINPVNCSPERIIRATLNKVLVALSWNF